MSPTVLVAEDEWLVGMDIVDELEGAGFRAVGPFATIRDALDYCRSSTPDGAVLDVRLSDGECFALADLLDERDVPILFHSGHASRPALMQRYPRAELCSKPSLSAEIVRRIERMRRSQ